MEDTIAAIATGVGEAGIGVIRISGPKAKEILGSIFKPSGKMDYFASRKLMYGHIVDDANNELIDEVMAVFMKEPKTYTKEDVAEIYCHGNPISLKKTLEQVLRSGARPAERGEFTKRAFLNGRLDLSQAEAVMDLISAKTDKSFDVAMSQLEGDLSLRIKEIRSEMMSVLVDLTVNLDYPDEDIEEITYDKLINSLIPIYNNVEELGKTADKGRVLRDGLMTVIIGKPNVGKSSLMNALLGEQRAIVTDIPGTTRDTIEEMVDIKGIPVKIVDTAGMRETEDIVENIGIKKAKQSFNDADLVVFIIDSSEGLTEEDRAIFSHLDSKRSIILLNKTDKGMNFSSADIEKIVPGTRIISASLIKHEGVKELEEAIYEMVLGGDVSTAGRAIITNVRHKSLIEKSLSLISDSIAAAKMGEALDFIEVDVRQSYETLGEIIGETASADIIDEVFARFCLGK